jgi:hypothetical protein
MYEKKNQPLAPKSTYFMRLRKTTGLGLLAIAVAMFIGMLGYHHFEKMSWVDAFVNAAMILSGMGPMGTLSTAAGKIFAGFYALFSGLLFILIIGLIFAPIFHRFFHKFHLDSSPQTKPKSKSSRAL